MSITTEQIKELRDETGISVMQCKRALEEAGGDMEKARMILGKKSTEVAAKKADRDTTEGAVTIISNEDKVSAVMLNCETDFVAKNEDFVNLGNTLAQIALEKGAEVAEKEAEALINTTIQKVGENIRLSKIEIIEAGVKGHYIHNKKIGVIVVLSGGNEELARDIAMHITAMKPEFINTDDIPETAKNMALEIFEKEVAESDKPEDIKKKILEGKIDTYFKERTLTEQTFIKNPNLKIKDLLKDGDSPIKIEKVIILDPSQ